jgi:hypothetical protein
LLNKGYFSKQKKELPLVALFWQEKLAFLFTRISTSVGAKKLDYIPNLYETLGFLYNLKRIEYICK